MTATVGGSATFMLRTEGGVGGICTTPTDKLEEEEGEEGGVVRTEEPLQPSMLTISQLLQFSLLQSMVILT